MTEREREREVWVSGERTISINPDETDSINPISNDENNAVSNRFCSLCSCGFSVRMREYHVSSSQHRQALDAYRRRKLVIEENIMDASGSSKQEQQFVGAKPAYNQGRCPFSRREKNFPGHASDARRAPCPSCVIPPSTCVLCFALLVSCTPHRTFILSPSLLWKSSKTQNTGEQRMGSGESCA